MSAWMIAPAVVVVWLGVLFVIVAGNHRLHRHVDAKTDLIRLDQQLNHKEREQ